MWVDIDGHVPQDRRVFVVFGIIVFVREENYLRKYCTVRVSYDCRVYCTSISRIVDDCVG